MVSKAVALIAAIIADFRETERVHHQGNRKSNKEIKVKQTKVEKKQKGPMQLTWKQIW